MDRTRTPQSGIFAEGDRHHGFVEFDVVRSGGPVAADAALGEALAGLVTTAGESPWHGVVCLGSGLARELLGDDVPPGLRDFGGVGKGDRHAPATQHDLMIWIHGPDSDVVFDGMRDSVRSLGGSAVVVGETAGFVYHDSRDLSGFIDGTENPALDEAPGVAVVAGGPGGGGSLVFSQRWIHDFDAIESMPVPEQEKVIGRTKADSVELDPLPPDSHVARMVVADDSGEEIEIYRRSVPYGSTTEAGLYFLAFTDDLDKIDLMLRRMYGLVDGPSDRLLEWSRPVSGAYWFAPSVESMEALGSRT